MSLVDVAAGRGGLLATILERNPPLARLVNDGGLAYRCRFVDGNFCEAVPVGSDAYIPLPIPPATLAVKGSEIAAKSRAS